jgi:CO/xanthine dehydrogenase Mo-binding subunit
MKDVDQPDPANPINYTPIGGNTTRIDSLGKVTGKTRFAVDIVMPGMLHGYVLRSPHHHARLLKLDTSEAIKLPGVVRIITATDIPGINELVGYSVGEPILTPPGETVKQKGAPVALVVAHSLAQAQQAASYIHAEYEPLPHIFDAAAAIQPEAFKIYPKGNVLSDYKLAHGDLQAAYALSDIILETEYLTSMQEHSAMECEATLGYLDEQARVTVIGGTHEPHWQRGYIAQTLGIDPASVRVIMPPTGGSFGGRQDPWPLVAAGLMTYLLRLPVRLAYSRREVFDATPKRHAYCVNLKIGATANGYLTGIQARIDANTGGYDSAGYWIPNYAVTASGGAYEWRAVDAYARAVFTNVGKCGQFRGFGTPQSVFALECTLDELSQRLGADPLELRLKNCLQQNHTSFLGYPVAESLGYTEVLNSIRPRFQELIAESQEFNQQQVNSPYSMGVGLAGMWYRFGKSGDLRIETHSELASDGHFVVYCSAPDYGQGISTVMVQLAADSLGVPLHCIELVNADTALTPDSNVQGASRATYFIGSSVRNATATLKREIFAVAAEMVDHDPADLILEANCVTARSNPVCSVSLQAVAEEFDRLGKTRRVVGVFDLSSQFPEQTRPEYLPLITTGAQAVQLVVDRLTGLVQVKHIVAAHDVGRTINLSDAHGQIQGAILMGLGSALSEEYLPGITTGFADYILPNINAMPEMEVLLVEVPSYYGPLGAKGLGETAILPTAPAIVNAISRAIKARIRRIPATPERVLAAIRESRIIV